MRDETISATRAVVMNRPRRQLLAGTRLAGDQDSARRDRDRLEQLKEIPHRSAAADEPVDPITLFELRSQIGVLRSQAPLFERRVQHVEQRVELKRLGDEVGRSLLDRVDGVLDRAEAGDDDGDDVRIALERRLEDSSAVHARQSEVRDDDVEREIGEPRERFLAARRLLDDEAMVRESFGDSLTQRRLVVDEEQMFRVFSHLVARRYFDTPTIRGQRCFRVDATEERFAFR